MKRCKKNNRQNRQNEMAELTQQIKEAAVAVETMPECTNKSYARAYITGAQLAQMDGAVAEAYQNLIAAMSLANNPYADFVMR